MSSSEINKIAGALIGALLVFMLLGFFSAKIYGTSAGGHHGPEELAFAMELETSEPTEPEEPVAVDYAALVASADLSEGEKLFRRCGSCHKVEDGSNGVGPHLWGVVGRDIGDVDGYAYSAVLADAPGDWTLTELSAFLENPKEYAPGTKMVFKGLEDPADRVNLIAWLNEADGTPIELAAAPAASEETAAAPAATEETAAAPTATEETAAAPTATEETAAAPAATEETAVAPAATEENAAEPAATEETAAAPAATEETAAAPAATEETAAAPAATEETAVVAASFPTGDAEAGAKVFRKCRACHKVEDGKNGVGPHLWGVIGRDIASVEGYNYSEALGGLPGEWTATELAAFLEKPKDYAPGTKMAYAGLRKEEDRINIITYLNEADGTPDPLQ